MRTIDDVSKLKRSPVEHSKSTPFLPVREAKHQSTSQWEPSLSPGITRGNNSTAPGGSCPDTCSPGEFPLDEIVLFGLCYGAKGATAGHFKVEPTIAQAKMIHTHTPANNSKISASLLSALGGCPTLPLQKTCNLLLSSSAPSPTNPARAAATPASNVYPRTQLRPNSYAGVGVK